MGSGITEDVLGEEGVRTTKKLSRRGRAGRTGSDIGRAFRDPRELQPPRIDAERDVLELRALIERIQRAMLRGTGRAATIKTSPLGVTRRKQTPQRRLKGVF